jgi:pyrroline-5-carboxylate reductase
LRREKRPSSRAGKIAFIGGGRMAEALIKGLINSKKTAPAEIIASDIQQTRRDFLKKNFGVKVTDDNRDCVEFADTLVLAVKPQFMRDAIRGLKVNPGQLVISIAAGIPLSTLQKYFEGNPVIRVMPNNPALVGAGISAIACGELVKDKDKNKAETIFRSVGEIVAVPEKMMDAVTGLSGSGPAFVYSFVEAMAEAGEGLGIPKETAQKLAIETLAGAAETLKKTGKTAQELKEMVVSPGGTTLAGLKVLEDRDMRSIVIDAITGAARRAKELSKEWT